MTYPPRCTSRTGDRLQLPVSLSEESQRLLAVAHQHVLHQTLRAPDRYDNSWSALPAASAGASFHAAISKGKFHAMIRATSPSGSWK